jgi:hypothetical protein
MNSAVYQLSSQFSESDRQDSLDQNSAEKSSDEFSRRSRDDAQGNTALDPENRLLSRMNRRRHDFETQRDAMLAVAGTLDEKSGGPPTQLASSRRTIYTFVNRMDVPPVMTTFDFPSPSTSCPQREQTTVAPQALYLMNSEFAADGAAAMLRRSDVATLNSTAAKVDRLHQILFSRPATRSDVQRAEAYLGTSPDKKTWQQYAHALLLANEFVFAD